MRDKIYSIDQNMNVPDEKKDDMENKDKPLGEWMLREAQINCLGHEDCHDCPFCLDDGDCDIRAVPSSWLLYEHDEKRTKENVQIIKRLEPLKPRLAEILGVEVGENFSVFRGATEANTFHVSESGEIKCNEMIATMGGITLAHAINHPESIIRAPRLTESELAICKAVGAKWVSRNTIGCNALHLWDSKPEENGGNYFNGKAVSLATVAESLFPSVRPGDCICVEDAEQRKNKMKSACTNNAT